MKILYLLQEFPYPPATGISRKIYALLRYLSGRGWQCDILCFGSAEDAARSGAFEAAVPGVKVLAVIPPPSGLAGRLKKIWSLLRGLPPSLGGFNSAEFREALLKAGRAKVYDAVHYDVINVAQYLPWGPKAPSLLSSNDAISLFYKRMAAGSSGLRRVYLSFSARLITGYERKVYPEFDRVHVVSEADAVHLREVCPALQVSVIPIAVDDSLSGAPPGCAGSGRGKLQVAFTGNLDIPGIRSGLFNFMSEAYSDIVSSSAPFEFLVLGPKASPEDERRLAGFPGVRYFRWVDDYSAFLASADVLLVLDRSGTGIKTRVLDAMALAKPVIGTGVAFGGIAAVDGRDCLICNTPAEVADALKRLLADAALRRRIGDAARELIVSRYTMPVTGPRWETLYAGLKEAV